MSSPPPEFLYNFQLDMSTALRESATPLEPDADTTSSMIPGTCASFATFASDFKSASATAVEVHAMNNDQDSVSSGPRAAVSDIPQLIPQVVAYVKKYMAQYDGSHDFNHILRVLGLAHVLRNQDPAAYDKDIVTLAALLHDVGDRKYLKPGQDGKTMVEDVLKKMGADTELAEKIQCIVNCVSYSAEIKAGGSAAIQACIEQYGRELEVVQDADRLDAIGAVGVGRCFAFGGMKGRGLQDSIDHFSDKLEKLQDMMKTKLGREMAEERTRRIVMMRKAWESENEQAMQGLEEGLDLDA